jgi:hypothetical protein
MSGTALFGPLLPSQTKPYPTQQQHPEDSEMGTETMEGDGAMPLLVVTVDLRTGGYDLFDSRIGQVTLYPNYGAKVGDRVLTADHVVRVVAVSECGNLLELELRES